MEGGAEQGELAGEGDAAAQSGEAALEDLGTDGEVGGAQTAVNRTAAVSTGGEEEVIDLAVYTIPARATRRGGGGDDGEARGGADLDRGSRRQ